MIHRLELEMRAPLIERTRRERGNDLLSAVRFPVQFVHADKLTGVTIRVSGAGGRHLTPAFIERTRAYHRHLSLLLLRVAPDV